MNRRPLITQLRDLMPPHDDAGDSVNWQEIEQIWGVRFPQDYKEFVATYGEGEVDAFLTFLFPGWTKRPFSSGDMTKETAKARWMWLKKTPAGYGAPDTAPIIAWGVSARADLLCWVTDELNPERWPVAVWSGCGLTWQIYDCGMLEYLVRLFRGEFDDLWECADGARRFVHVREAQRLRVSCSKSDIEEPDSCAGMFTPPLSRPPNQNE